jgi:hypothetical protein
VHIKFWGPLVSSVIFGQLCHWHRTPLVNGAIDTRYHPWQRWVFVQSLYCWILSVTDTTHLRSAMSLTLPITDAVPLLDYVRLRLDPSLHYFECGSGSTQNVTDLQPWWAVSLTPLTSGHRCHWHSTPVVSGVIDTAHHRSAVSLILPTTDQRCHWHCWPQKILYESWISQQIWIFIQNGCNPLIMGPDGVFWWRRAGVENLLYTTSILRFFSKFTVRCLEIWYWYFPIQVTLQQCWLIHSIWRICMWPMNKLDNNPGSKFQIWKLPKAYYIPQI